MGRRAMVGWASALWVLVAGVSAGHEVGPPQGSVGSYLRARPEEGVATLLAQRERELEQLRARLAEVEDQDYFAALALGVADALDQTGLPERSRRQVASAIVREARRNGLDPLLVVAVIRTESAFDRFAISPAGALGLMQVMPETGRYWARARGGKLHRPLELFDPELNIELGTSYLASLILTFGSLEHALLAYNAGPTSARRQLAGQEASRSLSGYPRKVLGQYRRLKSTAEASVENVSAAGGLRPRPNALAR